LRRLDFGLIGGLADQAIVSLGNFALTVLLARALPAADYGVLSVALSFILFFNTLHQALVIYPLSVRGAAASARDFPALAGVALLATPLCALAFLPGLGAGLGSLARGDLLPWAFLALLAWQWQEVVRRGLLARGRYRAAIAIDAVRYFGTAGAVSLLSPHITAGDVLLLIALLSLLAVLPFLRESWRAAKPAAHVLPAELAGQWRLAAPVLGASLLTALSVQWFLWLLAWQGRPDRAAELVALANIVSVANPLILGVENILVPEVARLRDRLDFPALLGLVARRGLVCTLLIAPIFLAILLFPDQAARLFYGAATPYAGRTGSLRILVAAYVATLAATVVGAALRGLRASGAVLRMQLYPAVLGLTLGTWLTWYYGVPGACLAALLAGILRAGAGLHFLLRLREAP
jgi:O-antigen/teichoic acid export membrane protein